MRNDCLQELFGSVLSILEQHACVIVPGLGGFVVNESPARFSSEEDTFYPPRREIFFNSLLSHNDGLLVQDYMKRGKSFDEASRCVDEAVSIIQKELESGRTVLAGDWGVLSREGKFYRFVQVRQVLKNRTTFGLQEFYFPKIHQKCSSVAEEDVKPLEAKFSFKPLAVGLATIFALLFVVQPLQNEGANNIASLQSATMLMANLNAEVSMKNQQITILQDELDHYENATEGFYLILNDFTDLSDAQNYMKHYGDLLPDDACVISLKNKFFVSVASSHSKEDLQTKKEGLSIEEDLLDKSYILSVTKLAR